MICRRCDCFGHDSAYDNNCRVLRQTYIDDSKCPFHKDKDEVDRDKIEQAITKHRGYLVCQ